LQLFIGSASDKDTDTLGDYIVFYVDEQIQNELQATSFFFLDVAIFDNAPFQLFF